MRLLAVRLQNLNSLQGGPHEVRFDVPPLGESSVFLITGATGAGKSTLLDAITLALYGKAARYGSEKADEMMSRHTSECLAEVDFVAKGRTLRATWRLSKTKTGNLKPTQRRLADVTTNELIAEKGKEIDDIIERETGLDAQRFMRSVLLAQGQFAAFLKAKPGERAELLEKITGTEIYSALSKLAYTTYQAKEQQRVMLSTRQEALRVLSSEERTELAAKLEAARAAAIQAQADHTRFTAQHNELRERQRLQRDLAKVAATLTDLSPKLTTATQSGQQAHTHSLQAQAARTAREPIWEQAAGLSAQAAQHEQQLKESRERYTEANKALKEIEQRVTRARDALTQHDDAARSIAEWLAAHAADAQLSEQGIAHRQTLQQWRPAFARMEQAQQHHARLMESETQLGAMQQQLSTARRDVITQRKAHEDAQRQAEAQRALVEQAQRVASLDDRRHELKDGEACPLCGALDHPFALHEPDASSQLASARTLLKAFEKQRDEFARDVAAAETSIARTEAQVQAAQTKRDESHAALLLLTSPDAAGVAKLVAAAEQHRVLGAASPEAAEKLLASLDQRAQAFAKQSAQASELTAKRQRLESDLALLQQQVKAAQQVVDERVAEGKTLRAAADALTAKLHALLGEKKLDEDRQSHHAAAASAESAARAADSAVNELKQRLAAAEGQRDQLTQRVTELGAATVEDRVVTECQTALEVAAAQLTKSQRDAGALEQQLKSDDEAQARRATEGTQLQQAEADSRKWGRMKELIGSADGARFARFAQTLSLRQLISLANAHLEQLSPRYRLVAAEGDELDLRIVDLYQAATQRPMESLSGGESFLASLALALGLSELASQHHPIDSLFIDEGFGSLDADTLEVAMSALENLHSQGKTIGLISHVETMKERIGTQIRVIRSSAGTSRIEVA